MKIRLREYILIFFCLSSWGLCDEQIDPAPELVKEHQSMPESHKKRKINREKEAEGTEALNRFSGDPIPKSRYELNGQTLEVDPD